MIQGNLIYLLIDFKNFRRISNKVFIFLFIFVFASMNFITNDIIVSNIFYYDIEEIKLPIWREFISYQKRFFKVHWLKKIFNRNNNLDFINDPDNYSKELIMDITMNNLKKY